MKHAYLKDQMNDPINTQAFASGETDREVLEALGDYLREEYEGSTVDFTVGQDGEDYAVIDGTTNISGSHIKVRWCEAIERAIDLVHEMGLEEFAKALWAETSNIYDGVAEYSISEDRIIFSSWLHGSVGESSDPDRVEIHRFKAYNFEHDGFEITDLFSHDEIAYMNRYYGGDRKRFCRSKKNRTSHGDPWGFSGRTLSERCADAAAFYFAQKWSEIESDLLGNAED